MKVKQQLMWALVGPWRHRDTGVQEIYSHSVKRTRQESIKTIVVSGDKRWCWKALYRRGWRCVRVSVSLVEP